MNTPLKILLADDHPLLRRGLREEINEVAALSVLAEAADGQEALDKIAQYQPDIAVLDIDMPRLDGFKVARAVMTHNWAVKLAFLTVHREESFLHKALDIGVLGYVLKDSASSDIVACLQTIATGQLYVSPALQEYLLKRLRRPASGREGLASLTPTERTVLYLIAEYKTTNDIAEGLYISHRTVQKHCNNIRQKLALRGHKALMRFAVAGGKH